MRKVILPLFPFFTLFPNSFSQMPDYVYAKWLFVPEIKQGFDYALDAAKLTYKDFTFRTDYWEIDSARLNKVKHLMGLPLSLPHKAVEIAKTCQVEYPLKIPNTLRVAAGIHDEKIFDPILFESVESIKRRALELMSNSNIFVPKKWANYPKTFRENVLFLLSNTQVEAVPMRYNLQAKDFLSSALERLMREYTNDGYPIEYNQNELDFVQNELPKLILEDTSQEKLSVDALDSIQKLEESRTRELVPLVTAPRYSITNKYIVAHFFRSLWKASNLANTSSDQFQTTQKEILWKDDKLRAVIGGPGPNHYKGDYALIIDFGGDDTYELTRRPNFTGQVIIDLDGNDKYFALEDYALACGYFGYSVLIDVAGDDLYQGKNFSVGCGFFGCGLLWDQAGNDTYIGDQFTQGAGGFGIGILKDDGGNDRYQSARASQGFGFVRGVGALLDASGSDNYYAGGKYKELIGLSGEIRYMSESQGYATGLRPDLSGGMGFLFDYDGDDSYNVDMYGQGASYWWGLGALVDFKGNDRYLAQQYAQGAGVHMSLGCLVDSSGNDFYYSKGVSQGCGHDWGAGMLFDLAGNDNYVVTDGSQAYGSANGFGILADGAGNDGYYVKDKTNTQGVGNPRREYGSIAIFLDCGGTDRYDGNGGENRIWKPEKTTWGVGVDGEFGVVDSAQVKK